MTLFQIAGILGALGAVALVARAVRRRRLAPGVGLLWILAWLAAGAFIARPGWTVVLAHTLGIARGADLVFYLAVLGGMVGFLALYLRLRRLDEQITRLVREVALSSREADGARSEGGDAD